MTTSSIELIANTDVQLQFAVEQFYYREANLLDERQFQQWLSLFSADAEYLMPSRYSPQADVSKRDTENYLNPEQEFEGMEVDASPLREESSMILAFRVQRAYKSNAWGSNPPARTRRNVSNIMISLSSEANSPQELRVQSNFILYYSRHRDDNHIYSGQRIDTLIQDADTFKIAKREIRLDWNLIPVPTVGLFF